MRYREYQPPIKLAAWIKLFWDLKDHSNDPFPDSNVADDFPELVVHFLSLIAEIDQAGRASASMVIF